MAEVIIASATPAGEGALAVARLSGGGVLTVAAGFLEPARLEPRRATLARVFDREGKTVERAMAVFFPGPASYTGEDVLELTVHGSPYLVSRLCELAVQAGARPARPGEFTLRAYLNGRMDLAQAEAVAHLIRARTEVAARVAIDQLEGGLSRTVERLRKDAAGELAVLEAALDHPDEDLPAFDADRASSALRELGRRAARLAATHRRGRLASEGARVAIVGRPNAGKSSLLNALLGRERAIVSPEPGTTRDTVEEAADLSGVRAVLVDTAGLRPDSEAGGIEREGMRRARRSLEASDAAVVVLDRSLDFDEQDRRLLEQAAAGGRPVVVALNKSDLPRRLAAPELHGKVVEVSAVTGAGIERLASALREGVAEAAPAEGEPLVLTIRHRRGLEAASAAFERAATSTREGELAAVHLREALAELGQIVGETPSEEVLREVFSRFCIGK